MILAYPLIHFLGVNNFIAIALGAGFSLFIILLAFLANHWALSLTGKSFLRVVLGGMVVRFALVGLVLFLVWKYTRVNLYAFIGGLLGFYFVLQVFEVKFIQKYLLKKPKPSLE
ncbi:MAG: hypothetical protein D6814_15330 [Calditrichaeota bacterium]|nr:MAG: hypothetical protein D6814_15330 [Calditrichota bacterium]